MAMHNMVHDDIKRKVITGKNMTAAEVPDLRNLLKQEMDKGVREFDFDMQNTQYLDSTGIGLLIATHNSVVARQGSVRLTNVSEEIMRLLNTMRLSSRLNASSHGEPDNG